MDELLVLVEAEKRRLYPKVRSFAQGRPGLARSLEFTGAGRGDDRLARVKHAGREAAAVVLFR